LKDLQHLYYFERLLEEVNNDLVRKAQEKRTETEHQRLPPHLVAGF